MNNAVMCFKMNVLLVIEKGAIYTGANRLNVFFFFFNFYFVMHFLFSVNYNKDSN